MESRVREFVSVDNHQESSGDRMTTDCCQFARQADLLLREQNTKMLLFELRASASAKIRSDRIGSVRFDSGNADAS